MNERCTCGTRLVEDALFCHRCGRPTRELVAAEVVVEEQPVLAPPAPPEAPREINLRDKAAVRTAMLMATMVSVMLFLPFGGVLRVMASVLVLPASGFGAVYLYQRRTGSFLTVAGGARIGWLTGLFVFVITLVMLSAMMVALMNPEVRDAVRQQVMAAGAELNFDEFWEGMQSPKVFSALFALFLFFTALPMIGGAVGAKVLEKE